MYLGCRTQQGHAGTELEVPSLASTVSKVLFRTLGEKIIKGSPRSRPGILHFQPVGQDFIPLI